MMNKPQHIFNNYHQEKLQEKLIIFNLIRL